MKKIILGVLFFTLCSAWASGEQKAVLNSLDSIEKNSLGFAVNGFARGGFFFSGMDSEALLEEEPHSEYMSFTDFLLTFSIRPSNETRAMFDLRFHKDWQSAYREGHNVPIITWWSYDGLILDGKLKFNLGTMRVAHTPLTIATPALDFIFEPQIFAERRAEIMADRYLDDSGRRLMQGLNAEMNFAAGPIDNILIQATLARLRNNAKKTNQVFYDFDNRDRYAAAARFGVEAFGVNIGVGDVYSFDRVRSNRTKSLPMASEDSTDYEFNNVLSFTGGIDSKKWLSGSIRFGANAELAISNWRHYRDRWKMETENAVSLGMPTNSIPCLQCPDNVLGEYHYPYYTDSSRVARVPVYELSRADLLRDQTAFLADAFVSYSKSSLEVKLSGHYLKTDVDFESELAANPSYSPVMPILNSNAVFDSATNSDFDNVLNVFRSGSLENLYSSLYYTLPQNAASMAFGSGGTPGNPNLNNLYNNYKFGHYYRNAYSYRVHTLLERRDTSAAHYLDPSVNMALPNGYATPDRHGGDANLAVNWNEAVLLRGVFGHYASDSSGDYTRLGGGLSVKIGRLATFLPKPIDISASYEQNKEKGGMEREATRIMAGFSAGIWRGLSLLGGVQLLDKTFGVPYGGIVNKTSEKLLLVGPSIKISERASFVLQGGLLSNSISATVNDTELEISKHTELEISKSLISGIVKVGF